MPSLSRGCLGRTKNQVKSVIECLACVSRYVCLASCLLPTMLVFAQPNSGGVSSGTEVQATSETQAKLDKLNANLKAVQAKNDLAGAAKILNASGALYYFDVSDYSSAIDPYQQALADAKAVPDLQLQATALNGVANCYRLQSKLELAVQDFEQALAITRQSGDKRSQSIALSGLGTVSSRMGKTQKALEYLSEALPLVRDTGTVRKRQRFCGASCLSTIT